MKQTIKNIVVTVLQPLFQLLPSPDDTAVQIVRFRLQLIPLKMELFLEIKLQNFRPIVGKFFLPPKAPTVEFFPVDFELIKTNFFSLDRYFTGKNGNKKCDILLVKVPCFPTPF